MFLFNRIFRTAAVMAVLMLAAAGAVRVDAQSPAEPRRINIPHFDENVVWAQSALFWFGQNEVSLPGKNYADVRMAYTDDALHIRVTVVDYFLWYNSNATANSDLTQYDAAKIFIDTAPGATTPQTHSFQFLVGARHWQDMTNYMRQARGTGGGWDTGWQPATPWTGASEMSWGCNPGPNNNDCSVDFGWTGFFTIPWQTLGLSTPPTDSTVWKFGVELFDRDDQPPAGAVPVEFWPETFTEPSPATWGDLHFGYTHYTPPAVSPKGTTVIRAASPGDNTVEDAWMGGGGWCNSGQEGDRMGSETNHGGDAELYVGNEIAETNFPCFNKSFLRFSLDDIPAGKKILSATLTLHHWGNADPTLARPSWIHLFKITDPWSEMGITWNNAPLAQENLSVTKVDPLRSFPGWPGIPNDWDASQAVADAYAAGEPLSIALYSSDSAEHSSKYLTASEAEDWDAEGRPTLTVVWGDTSPLEIEPANKAIEPGGTAVYTVQIQDGNGFASTVNLNATASAPGVTVSLSSDTVSPPANVMLTVADNHGSGTLQPGQWYHITVTGTSDGVEHSTTANLLVGGSRVYLPLVLK